MSTNRIAILDEYAGFGDLGFPGPAPERRKMARRRRKKITRKQRSHMKRFARAARACGRRRKGSFKSCMRKKLKKKGRR